MTAQTVVVILATVVDVWTTVDPAGQLGASKQISVTRYMEVTRKTEVVVSLRARPTSAKASVDAEQGYRIGLLGTARGWTADAAPPKRAARWSNFMAEAECR